MTKSAGAAATLLSLACISHRARAQGNDRSAPTGGRSELMGNTGVALGRDGSAPFINPATIGAIEDQRIAFSVNFFTASLTRYSGWNQPGAVDPQFGGVALKGTGDSTSRFNGWPSTLCLFFTLAGIIETDEEGNARGERRGRQKLAVCLGNTEGESVSLTGLAFSGSTAAGTTLETESIARNWSRLYVGPTYSVAVTNALTLGASLHGVVASDSFVVDGESATSTTSGAAQSGLGASGYGYSFDLAATLGATYHVGALTLGLSGELPALHVAGRFQATSHSESSATGATDDITSGAGTFVARPPTRITAGAAYEWPRLTLEVDESFDFPSSGAVSSTMSVTSTDIAAGASTASSFIATYRVPFRSTWNTSAGLEYFVTPGLSLIGGASTNLSELAALMPASAVGNLVQSRTDHVGMSLGIGSYGGGRDLLIGMQLDYGWGQALVVNPFQLPNQWSVTDIQTYSVTAVLAGATDIRAIGRAVEKVENAVFKSTPETPPTAPSGTDRAR